MTNFTPKVKRLNTGGQDQVKLGVALQKQGRLDEALAQFKSVLQDNPTSMRANLGAGNIEFKQKHYDEALVYYQAAIRLDPLKPIPILKAGKAYLKQRNWDKALEQFKAVVSLDPKAVQAYTGLGQVLARQGKYEQAIQEFRKALSLDPQLLMIRIRLAQAYIDQEKLAEAASELKTAININPQKWISYAELGRVYLKQNNYSGASEVLRQAVELNPDVPSSVRLSLVEALIQENKLEEAATLLREVPQSKQLAPRQHKLWGDIYHRQGLHREATEAYRAATLLAAEGDADSDMMDNLEALEDQDDDGWEELAESYKSSADSLVSENRKGRRRMR
ncbi:tetratricopeptide repeat protein [Trichocoleus sp. FACHB-90]|uniref:tetratricopeptide repeat protein n=1 Tax=Cyanophyceae TaxID=3028117 RepID=UPI0016834E38|nr:tetratricopeptide repeat protein [Trichocoleus sp. FACHB-90]